MNIALIVGAGKGARMNEKINKIFLTLVDKPIICHTIGAFENSKMIDSIILVGNKDDIGELNKLTRKFNFKKIKKVVVGGEKRQDSVYNGLKATTAEDDDIILIHNAANPFITERTLKEVIAAAKSYGAAVSAIKAKDTIKEVDKDNFVVKTLDRETLWQMQTPQAIKYGLAKRAFEIAQKENFYATDDVGLVERLGERVKVIETEQENIKITTKGDLEIAQGIMGNVRVGLGQDSHRFTKEKKPLVLGGVLIPNEVGLEANSDGDVILHALFNALSQSIGGKSIGCYADEMCKKGVKDSKEYLKIARKMIEGHKVKNIGIMVEAKKPRLEPYAGKMKRCIADILKIKTEDIGITFTSGEELTEFGKGKGIQCFAVVAVE